MATLNLAQRTATLMLLLSLSLTGCASWGPAAAPAENGERESVGVEALGSSEAEPAPAEEEVAQTAPVDLEKEVEISSESGAASEPVAPDLYKSEAAPGSSEASGGIASAPSLVLPTASPVAGEIAPMAAEEDLADSSTTESSMVAAPQAEPLKAGEVDDNAKWDDYLLYRRGYQGLPVHDRDITERYIVEVMDEQERPILGAQVRFFIPEQNEQGQEVYSARTYANGRVLFHPLALTGVSLEQVERFQVEVEYNGLQEQFSLTRFEAQASTGFTDRWTVTLQPEQQQEELALDVLYLVDATGSMGDEIAKIQSTIFDVSAQIDALPGRPEVRYGLVTYRDRGDTFVTRSYDFTPDVREFSKNLDMLLADGGGDNPESLNEGLHEAIHGVEWRGDGAIQLIFLVADAPPHLDYPQDYDYAVEMDTAAQRGIKIFPIASSGLDDQGEYIFRQLAQYTQGRFIFLTYEGPTNSGSPGETTTHHVEDYSVENLGALLVKLVAEELAYQNPQLDQN